MLIFEQLPNFFYRFQSNHDYYHQYHYHHLYYACYVHDYDGDDYYYITYDGREIIWSSAVGKLIYLKGKIDDRDYKSFIRLAKLNHWDQIKTTTESIDKYRKFITTHDAGNEHLTDICWDLN